VQDLFEDDDEDENDEELILTDCFSHLPGTATA
jgi:hypothetical protein